MPTSQPARRAGWRRPSRRAAKRSRPAWRSAEPRSRVARCWPASAPGARAARDRRRNIAMRPSPGATARPQEKGSWCPRTSCSRVSVLRRPVGRPAPATIPTAALGGAEGSADIIDERGETTTQRLAPGHQHVVVIPLRLKRRRGAQRLFQPPADAIALDRAADAFGHRQPYARRGDGFLSRLLAPTRLQRESRDRCAPSARDALVFRPSRQPAERFARGARPAILTQRCQGSLSRRVDRHTNGRTAAEAAACGSGGELLATARAASRDHLAAADRRRTSAKAMAALAHQLAGLIGPLHGLGLRIPIVGGKIERRPILNAQTLAAPATVDATKRRARK